MSCELLTGIQGICEYQTSGVERLWLANKADISTVSYNVDGQVTGITMASTGATFYEVVPALDTATYADDLAVAGSRRNFAQTITFGVAALNQSLVEVINTLGLGQFVAIVAFDGGYRLFGHLGSGLRASAMTDVSGTAEGNDGAIEVTLSGNNKGKAPFVAEAVLTTLDVL